jgi:long-chain acyl-CoA synthetase
MPYPNLATILDISSRKFPKRPAIVFGRKQITYKHLSDYTSRVAAGLLSIGIQRQDRIALFLDNCPEFIISYFAVLKAGATVVPINYMFKIEEAKYILEDSQACCLITSRAYLAMARELRLRLDSLKTIVTTNKTHGEDVIDFEYLHHRAPAEAAGYPTSADDMAVILYTSGTTGHPKGAVLSHHNLLSNAVDCARAIKVTHRDGFICILPLFHSFAATVCMNLPLLLGARIVLMKSVKPFKRVIRAIRKNRVTVFVGVPSMYNLLKEIKMPRIFNGPIIKLFNPVRLCISGAAALPVDTLKKFEQKFRIPLLEGYGLTEASPVVTLNPLKAVRKPGSIGVVLAAHIAVKVVDDKDRTLGPDAVGELLVQGPNVMGGYYQKTEASQEALKDGWLYTGDMAKIDSEGYAYIVGRKKEMINVRGLNVYPREIEEVLYQNPAVKEAAVIGIEDERKGEVPKGFVVLNEGAVATQRQIIDYLRQRLAAYKIPRTIEFRASLPKNSTGKILKRLLQDEENKKHT